MGGIWAPPTNGGTTLVELQDGRGSTVLLRAAGGEGVALGSGRAGSGGSGGGCWGEPGGRMGADGVAPCGHKWRQERKVSG